MYQISKLLTVHCKTLSTLKNVWQPYKRPHRHQSPLKDKLQFLEAKNGPDISRSHTLPITCQYGSSQYPTVLLISLWLVFTARIFNVSSCHHIWLSWCCNSFVANLEVNKCQRQSGQCHMLPFTWETGADKWILTTSKESGKQQFDVYKVTSYVLMRLIYFSDCYLHPDRLCVCSKNCKSWISIVKFPFIL